MMIPEFNKEALSARFRVEGLGAGPLLPTSPETNIFGLGDYDSGLFGLGQTIVPPKQELFNMGVYQPPMTSFYRTKTFRGIDGLGAADFKGMAGKWAPVLASAGGAIASTLFVSFKEGATAKNVGFGILALGLGITAVLGVMDATSA